MKPGCTYVEIPFQEKIVHSLEQIGVEKVIVFGSYSTGNHNTESDIDLLVVTSDAFTPSTFKEKMKVKLKIANTLDFVREKYSLDLLVFTSPMYKKFLEMNSAFQKDIATTGIVLYERNHESMA